MSLEQERQLVDECGQGNEKAFADLVRLMAPDIVRGLTRLVRDPALAEDLAQEAFLRAWRNMDRLKDPTRFRSWLWRIARCAALDELRGRFRRPPEAESLPLVAEEGPAPDVALPAEHDIERRELALKARAIIELLPPESVDLLRLRYEQDLGYREIAAKLAISVVQVKARLARARSALKDRLTPIAADWRCLDDERS